MPVGAIDASTATGLPAGVGKTPEEKAALGFERQLLVQLTEQLAKSAMPEGEESSAATNAYRDMLPGTLADAMVAAGGVGLAASLVAKGPGK
jgi:Rod binding domain-containing protein